MNAKQTRLCRLSGTTGIEMEEEQEEELPYDDPGQQVATAGPGFVSALADVLTHLSALRPPTTGQRVTKFHSVRPPQLPIRDYLFRIAKYFQCSRECFVLCLVYIDRIVKLHPDFTICSLNIHRLLVTSVMLAVKFFDDVYYSNAYYAKVGGVKTREVNILEGQFLQLIEWRLHVTPEEFDQYRAHVCNASGTPAASRPLENEIVEEEQEDRAMAVC